MMVDDNDDDKINKLQLTGEHCDSADVRQGGSVPDIDNLINLMSLHCPKSHQFSRKSYQFFQRYEPNCGKMPVLQC